MNQINPLVLIGGLLGVGALAAAAASQASNALPRVTRFAQVIVPTPGVNGQWDLFVTNLAANASSPSRGGSDMLAMIPGGQYIYIPASLAMAQNKTQDWTYTFTPRGATTTFTIIVPAAILAAYQAMPKTRAVQLSTEGNDMQRIRSIAVMVQTQNPCSVLDPQNVYNQVSHAISGFPADGSNAAAYIAWAATNVSQILTDAQNVQQCLQSGALSDPGGVESYLISAVPQLIQLIAKAANNGASNALANLSSSDSSGGSSSDSSGESSSDSSDSSMSDSSFSDSSDSTDSSTS